ncbi:MAG: DNA recombination/repair protein RecA [Candidatus Krumholzibacteria bacterium]|nr:DNA recombination/repair protein RecA [Candidatus Krumholzibacteria bacterium]
MASSRPASVLSRTINGAHILPAPTTTTIPPVPDRAPGGWSLDSLCGRFLEISSSGQTVSITAAASLILDSHQRGEPAAWVAVGGSTFFPPDFAECGIDLRALPVIRVPHTLSASRVADRLLRSGGFGAIVLDLGTDIDMRIAVQVRLAALAKKHHTTLLCLTQKEPAAPSMGPLVSLRAQGALHKTGFNRFTWELEVLRDKHRGLGWRHTEVCRGPDGLC